MKLFGLTIDPQSASDEQILTAIAAELELYRTEQAAGDAGYDFARVSFEYHRD